MKAFSVKLLVPVICCFLGQSVAQAQSNPKDPNRKTKVSTSYDKKKNETIAYIGPLELWKPPANSVSGEIDYEAVYLLVSFTYPGKRIKKPAKVTLVISSRSERGAEFTKNRTLSISAGNSVYNFGDMDSVGSAESDVPKTIGGRLGRVVQEGLRKEVPADDLSAVSRNEAASLTVGKRTFKLTRKHMEDLRNFVLLMEQEGLEF